MVPELPHVGAVLGVLQARRVRLVLRGQAADEHVRRLDHVVIHADQDHVLTLHIPKPNPSPPRWQVLLSFARIKFSYTERMEATAQ